MLSEDQAVNKIVNPAKTARGRRILKSREPQVHEPPKKCVFFKGAKTSQRMQDLLKDMYIMRKPFSVYLSNKNESEAHPFEDVDRCEHLCRVRDCPVFMMGSTSKKRPNRLVLGRTFAGSTLDMCEFLVSEYKSVAEFAAESTEKVKVPQLGSKPMVVFQGAWEQNDHLKSVKSLLGDLVVGAPAKAVVLEGLDRLVSVSAVDSATGEELAAAGITSNPAAKVDIVVRQHAVSFVKSGSELPRVELKEIGPYIKMRVDRQKVADFTTMKIAQAVPRELQPKKVKNITTDALGQKRGRIFLEKQDLNKVYTPHGNVESFTHGTPTPSKRAKLEKAGDLEFESADEE